MIIFSITLFPILGLFINSILGTKNLGFKFFRDTYLKGLLSFIPAFLLILVINGVIKRTNTYSNIFLFHLIYDFAVYYAIICFGYTFLFKNSMIYRFRDRISELITYECGFYTMVSLFDALYVYRWESPYLLYLLPGIRVAMIVIFAILPPLVGESVGFLKHIYILSLFLLPFSSAFVAFFFYINSFLISGLILVLLLILAVWLFYHYSPVIRKSSK